MKKLPLLLTVVPFGLAVWVAAPDPAPARQDQGPPAGVEVLTRGPVHEAYAEPADERPRATPVVPKQPPAPIPEVPPDQRPEGHDVIWIPGYWAWDDESQNFLWVSGIWREAPPDERWVTGYWQEVQGGWTWVPDFWARENETEVLYLPEPPAPPPEATPPAPDENSVYAPGVWVWRDNYYWRPGFWVGYRPGWAYVSAHYCWTPYGYVFVDGYWDYPLHLRGVLFAPVRLANTAWAANWTYVPSYVIWPDALLTALFVGPAADHYFFGDYFESSYAQQGYVPWVNYRVARTALDPTYAYYRHAFHGSPTWDRGLRELYMARQQGTIPRPPRTLAAQTQLVQNINNVRVQSTTVLRDLNITNVQNVVQVASPLNQVRDVHTKVLTAAAGRTAAPAVSTSVKLQAVPPDQRARFREQAGQLRAVQQQRQQAESRLHTEAAPGRAIQPRTTRLDLPKPVAPAE
jgi:hypothetical protein